MPLLKEQQIIVYLAARLESILIVNGYQTDLGLHVVPWTDAPMDPGLEILRLEYRDETGSAGYIAVGEHLHTLPVTLRIICLANDGTALTKLRLAQADVYTCINADINLGGLAQDINQEGSWSRDYGEQADRAAAASIKYLIEYTTPPGNPFSDITPIVPDINIGIYKTWAEMKALQDASQYVVTQDYCITDFRYRGAIPGTDPVEYHTGPIEPLIVEAVANNKLAAEAQSTIYSQDRLYYELEDSSGRGGDKGRIFARYDTARNIYVGCDFRSYKMRRYHNGFNGFFYPTPTVYLRSADWIQQSATEIIVTAPSDIFQAVPFLASIEAIIAQYNLTVIGKEDIGGGQWKLTLQDALPFPVTAYNYNGELSFTSTLYADILMSPGAEENYRNIYIPEGGTPGNVPLDVVFYTGAKEVYMAHGAVCTTINNAAKLYAFSTFDNNVIMSAGDSIFFSSAQNNRLKEVKDSLIRGVFINNIVESGIYQSSIGQHCQNWHVSGEINDAHINTAWSYLKVIGSVDVVGIVNGRGDTPGIFINGLSHAFFAETFNFNKTYIGLSNIEFTPNKSTIPVSIDITGLTTLNLAADQDAGVINVTGTDTTLDKIINPSGNFDFEIRPASGSTHTLTGTAFAAINADGQILLTTASIALNGDKREFVRLRKETITNGNGTFIVVKEIKRNVYI